MFKRTGSNRKGNDSKSSPKTPGRRGERVVSRMTSLTGQKKVEPTSPKHATKPSRANRGLGQLQHSRRT